MPNPSPHPSATRSGAAAGPLRFLVQVVGYLLVAIGVLDVVGVDLSQFLVGGAVTGVVIGIAARSPAEPLWPRVGRVLVTCTSVTVTWVSSCSRLRTLGPSVARSSPGAPHRDGGLPTSEPGLRAGTHDLGQL